MPSEITCPACGRRLRVPDGAQGQPLTCPLCLARLPVQPPLATAPGARQPRAADAEIRGDTKKTGAGLILLAVLGALGITFYLLIGGAFAAEGDVSLLVIALVVLAFLALVSTAIVLWRTRENPSARSVGRVIFGTLALAGSLIAGLFVVSVSLMVYLFAVCFSGRNPFKF